MDAATRDGWRRHASLVVLVAANLLPFVGVLVLGWDVGVVLLLFWAESGVIGFYSLVKLGYAARWAALGLVPFFLLHFGLFMAGHLAFILLFFVFGALGPEGPRPPRDWAGLGLADDLPWMLVSLAALFASHGFSLVHYFLRGPERGVLTVPRVMAEPYGRIVVMHLTILFGAFPVLALGSPTPAVALLVVLKVAVDGLAHWRQHRRRARPEARSLF